MGKIHTHYDNLKVARLAPQEVIRAAYKALSQKYHPDKNPGDEKAARIMAIVNSAYGTLADPQRRKEHDEWIAAEEWEIEWLESTHHEDKPGKARHDSDGAREVPRPATKALWRRWSWWASLLLCLCLGWLGAWLSLDPSGAPFASSWHSLLQAGGQLGVSVPGATPSEAKPKPEKIEIDSWAVGKPYAPEPAVAPAPDIKVTALSQVVLEAAPASASCERDRQTQALVAPNGEPWPEQSGYVQGFPVGNKGSDLQLTVDNSANGWPVFVKLYDTERRSNVRYLFVLANDKLLVEPLAFGKYEVRYQKVDASAEACAARQGATAQP